MKTSGTSFPAKAEDIQNFHRQRERIKKERTALVNQVRGLLAEYGIVINKGITAVRKDLPELLGDGENGLTALARELFAGHLEELHALDASERTRIRMSMRQWRAMDGPARLLGRGLGKRELVGRVATEVGMSLRKVSSVLKTACDE